MFERITEKTFSRIFPLMESSFPPTELRTREGQKQLLSNPFYRLYGVPDERGEFGAVFGVWEIDDFLYIDHFAVKEERRNGGFGGMLLDEFIEKKGKPVVLEVEEPKDEITQRRVNFYRRHGMVLNDYPYLQPPMREGMGRVPLMLMTKPGAIDPRTFERYKSLIYKIAYHYEGE